MEKQVCFSIFNVLYLKKRSINVQDLNLLKVFSAMMSMGSVNEAAEKLNITSSAVSQSLNKLRGIYNDPLFVRNGRGLKPTNYAIDLYDELKEPLSLLMNSHQTHSVFDPVKSKRTFRLSSNPDLDIIYLRKLRYLIKKEAPNIKLTVSAEDPDEEKIQKSLRIKDVDLILTTIPLEDMSYENLIMGYAKICVFCNAEHPRIGDTLSKEQFFKEEHATWTTARNATLVLNTLSRENLMKRNVVYSSPSIFNLAYIASISNLLTLGTYRHAEFLKDNKNIKILPVPFENNKLPIYCTWHKSFNKDDGIKWLLEMINKSLKDETDFELV